MGSEKTFSITVRKTSEGVFRDIKHNGNSLPTERIDRAFPSSSPMRARLDDLFNHCYDQIPGSAGSYEVKLSEAEFLYSY